MTAITTADGRLSAAGANAGLRNWLPSTVRHGLTLAWRALLKTRHNLESLLDLVLQPIIFVVMFVFLFGGAVSGDWRAYLQFVLPGIAVQTAIFGSMGTGLTLNTDLTKGVFDRFKSMPMSRSAPLVGGVFGDILRYVIGVGIVLGFGMALGFRVETGMLGVLGAFVLMLVFALAMCWIAVLIGVLAKSPQSMQGIGFIVMFPLTFGSNIFAPAQTMPGWLQAWVKVNPVSKLTEAVRGLLVGGPVAGPVTATLLWATLIVAIFLPISTAVYRRRT
jgi:oleandomycin transport system permease protein